MNQNPSFRAGIDGSNPQRVNNVRDALITAGVPASKIQTGSFGDPQLRHNNRVVVLLSN
jgi:hypothetical protein